MKIKTSSFLAAGAVFLFPLLAAAQVGGYGGYPPSSGSGSTCKFTDLASAFSCGLTILNSYVVPVIFAVAFVVFLIGIYRYFIAGGGSDEKVKEGRQFLLWSIIGFVVMFSVWGIINIFVGTFGFNNSTRPPIPTFNNTTSGSQTTTGLPIAPPAPNGSSYGGSTPPPSTPPPAAGVNANPYGSGAARY
ncbi:hypothetical protein H0X32_03470 [Patescibacteria group bacterium]|nr:hypothetical protein [Patescibacteria group bacterium]